VSDVWQQRYLRSWETYRDRLIQVTEKHLGLAMLARKDWISSASRQLIQDKRQRLLAELEVYKRLQKECRAALRRDRQCWADEMAEEAEIALQRGELKDAFANFRWLRSVAPWFSSPISGTDRLLLSDKASKNNRWREHYEKLLNRVPPPAVTGLDLQPGPPDPSVDSSPPMEQEVAAEVRRLKNGKAAGICCISAELLKAGGEAGIGWLTRGLVLQGYRRRLD